MAKRITIIGGGPGGYVCAVRGAQLGAQVTIVERDALGGTCLNWGCVPTKALLHGARLYRAIRDAGRFGIECTPAPVRFDKMMERKDVVVQNNVSGLESLLKRHGVTVIRGTGRLLDPHTVEIDNGEGNISREGAEAVVIATGSAPLVPSFMKLDKDRIVTTTGALDLQRLPVSVAVVGGSVSGCEFACMFGLLGSEVTLIEMLDKILPTEDAEISRRFAGALRSLGVRVMTKTAVRSVEWDDGTDSVTLVTEKGERMTASCCLAAMGRKLNIDNIGLDALGIEYSPKGIGVNERMETTIRDVYAVGDVTGKILLAHVASAQGIVAAENIMGIDATMDYSAVPSFIYTEPEIGSVGLKEEEAKAMGMDIMMGKAIFKTNAMAHAMSETTGFVKTVVDRKTKEILGVHILGPHATDLLAHAVTLVKGRMTSKMVKAMIHPHPTLSETTKEAVLAAMNQAIHAG